MMMMTTMSFTGSRMRTDKMMTIDGRLKPDNKTCVDTM